MLSLVALHCDYHLISHGMFTSLYDLVIPQTSSQSTHRNTGHRTSSLSAEFTPSCSGQADNLPVSKYEVTAGMQLHCA